MYDLCKLCSDLCKYMLGCVTKCDGVCSKIYSGLCQKVTGSVTSSSGICVKT
jgi:hypothetical protein